MRLILSKQASIVQKVSFHKHNLFHHQYHIEYLQDLNDTGSFSDESEKVPMCYIHCYLNKMGVIGQDNKVNKEKAVNMYQIEDDEMVDDCDKEMGK